MREVPGAGFGRRKCGRCSVPAQGGGNAGGSSRADSAARDAGMRKAGGGCCGARWERLGPALMPALPPREGRVSKSPLREVVSPRAASLRVTGGLCLSLAGHDSPAGKRAQRNQVGDGPSLAGVPGPPQCQDGPGHRNCCIQVQWDLCRHVWNINSTADAAGSGSFTPAEISACGEKESSAKPPQPLVRAQKVIREQLMSGRAPRAQRSVTQCGAPVPHSGPGCTGRSCRETRASF